MNATYDSTPHAALDPDMYIDVLNPEGDPVYTISGKSTESAMQTVWSQVANGLECYAVQGMIHRVDAADEVEVSHEGLQDAWDAGLADEDTMHFVWTPGEKTEVHSLAGAIDLAVILPVSIVMMLFPHARPSLKRYKPTADCMVSMWQTDESIMDIVDEIVDLEGSA